MSEQELRAAYPGAADAVAIHEMLGFEDFWAFVIGRGKPPGFIIDKLRQSAEDAIAFCTGPFTPAVRAQMDHPDFVRYVMSKLGCL